MDQNGIQILLVEDNPDDLHIALHALRKAGLSDKVVHVARDGAEALSFMFGAAAGERPKPRVILLDLKLPKVDGIEVLRRLKRDPHTQTIPVVVMTSSNEPRDLETCYSLGVNSYIVKPVNFEHFISTMAEIEKYWTSVNQVPAF